MKNVLVRRPTSIALLIIILSSFCFTKPILLRYQYHPKEVLTYKDIYRVVQKSEYFKVDHIDFVREAATTLECLSVNPDSSAELVMNFVTFETKVNEEKTHGEMEKLLNVPILLKRLATGKYVDVKPQGDVTSKQLKMIEEIKQGLEIDFGFPNKPVDVGDKWNDRTALSQDQGDMRVEEILSMKSIFEGYETVQGVRCAVVNLSVTVTGTVTTGSNEMPVKGNGRGLIFFDYASGKLIKEWLEFETTSTIEAPQGPMEIQSSVMTQTELQH